MTANEIPGVLTLLRNICLCRARGGVGKPLGWRAGGVELATAKLSPLRPTELFASRLGRVAF